MFTQEKSKNLNMLLCLNTVFTFTDEEGTIEEQEGLEGETDHKTELVDLAKDGTYLFCSKFCI